jgi:CubicO group peptidase (beta-lactamase class C family)
MLLRSALARCLSCLALVAIAGAGCAGPVRQLHPTSGNEFSLFPPERKSAPPITCTGGLDERCACFVRELEQRSQSIDVGGAFALAPPDGSIRTFTRSDALNAAQPITDDTRFPAASITKMFLAAAAVSLAQQGRIDLQQPIARSVPELDGETGVGRASLHQLLTHTSGLGNPPQCEAPTEDLPDLLRKHGKARLHAPPGAVFNYSNLGYGFVAIAIERVTGQRFEDVVHERVLVPAGIPEARFGFEGLALRGNVPEGVTAPSRCRAMWPSGGLLLNIREIAQWVATLAHPEASPLGQPLIAALTAPHVPTEERPGGAYGYGVQRVQQSGVTVYGHAGSLEGFTSFVGWAQGLGVAAVADRNGSYPIAAGYRALSTFLSLSADWQPPPGPAHPLPAYAGLYVDEAGTLGRLRVSLEEDQLAIDYLDNPPPLLPPNFRFVFEPGSEHARYVVTAVGVGERRSE